MKRRVGLILVLLFWCFGSAIAQESTSEPEPTVAPVPPAELQRMQAIMEEIDTAEDRAFNLLGVYEAIFGVVSVIGLAVTAAAFAGGLYIRGYIRRLEELQTTLEQRQTKLESTLISQQQTADERVEKRLEAFDNSIMARRQQLDERMQNAQIAISLMPLAERQYQARDLQGALDTYLRIHHLDPANPVALYHIGYICMRDNTVERLQEAEKVLKMALELDPKLHQAQAALGFVYRRLAEKQTDPAAREKGFRDARFYLQQALNYSPNLIDDDGESWYGALAGLHKRDNRLEEAILNYKKAAEVTPQSSYPHINLATLYLIQGRPYEEVEEEYAYAERLADMETRAQLNNYWGFADLLTARLAIYDPQPGSQGMELIENAIRDLRDVHPHDADDVLPLIQQTLRQLAEGLRTYGEDYLDRRAEFIDTVIEMLDGWIAEMGPITTIGSLDDPGRGGGQIADTTQ